MGLLAPLQLQAASGKRNQNHERSSSRTYTGFYTSDCDENYVCNNLVVIAGNNPVAITDQHPSDDQQFVTDIDASCGPQTTYFDDTAGQQYASNNGVACYYWTINIEFGAFNPLEQSPTGTMIDMPTRIAWESDEETLPLWVDYSTNHSDDNGNPIGVPILNSSYDYYNPGVEREYARKRLIVMRNEANPNWVSLTQNEYHTNASTWNGFPPRTVLIKTTRSPVAKYSQVSAGFYYEMQYNFYIRYITWDKYILDQGLNKLGTDANGNTTKMPILVNGTAPTDQVPLNGMGVPLADPIKPSDLVLLQFQVYPTCDFGVFGLDNCLQVGIGA